MTLFGVVSFGRSEYENIRIAAGIIRADGGTNCGCQCGPRSLALPRACDAAVESFKTS